MTVCEVGREVRHCVRWVLGCDRLRGGQRGVRHCVRWVLGCDSLRGGQRGVRHCVRGGGVRM